MGEGKVAQGKTKSSDLKTFLRLIVVSYVNTK